MGSALKSNFTGSQQVAQSLNTDNVYRCMYVKVKL